MAPKQQVPTEIITKENEHEFVTTEDCNKCPEDSACLPSAKDSKGLSVCMCFHYRAVPLRKGKICPRKTVTGVPSDTRNGAWPQVDHNQSVIQVHVLKDAGPKLVIDETLPKGQGHYLSPTFITAILGFFIFGIIVTTLLCFVKRKTLQRILRVNQAKSKMEMKEPLDGNGLLSVDRFVNNPTYETTCLDLSIRIFSNDEINLMAQIGQGCFGKVFKGALNGEEVAVKVVKKEYSDEVVKEVETMATFCHPNILHLIGIVKNSETEAPWLVFEFMEHGDLASVLRNCSKTYPVSSSLTFPSGDSNQLAVDQPEKQPLNLTHDTLMNFASQISEGMSYLSSQHFVHRDLAARNCLVSANGMVKISDFGLSRDVYTCDYYKIGGSRLLPLRWMAPESIMYGRFTLESDVWAYGILLWEIFTWGKQPYYGHSNEEVVQLILDGVLLCPPSDCPPIICQIMAGSWKTEPKDRLKFEQVSQKLLSKDNGKESDSDRITEKSKKVSMGSGINAWGPESGYEVPKSAFKVDYIEVI